MTLQTIVFGFAIASFLGSLFHLIRGGGIGKLVLYILLSWIGFWAGNFLAKQNGWTFVTIGNLHLGMATLSCLIFLVIGSWLSNINVKHG